MVYARFLAVFLVLSFALGCALGCASTTSVSGDAFAFNEGVDARVEGARVFVLEEPSMEVETDANGHFLFEGIEPGSEVTLVMDHPDFVPIQTSTIEVGAEGAERVTFQAVRPNIYNGLAALLGITPDPERCQMVTTVTRIGRSLYDPGAHGEAGATVTLDPPPPAESGPIYFNADVVPERGLSETSEDGGVLYLNLSPGVYTWRAEKEGMSFRELRMTCRAGMLVNASPPWGLQAL